tara:strand:- start:2558 stop:2671 length:114 start_codon:yes stop_codon:yes gene_type:complete
MDVDIITGIITAVFLIGLLLWVYSIGKDYKSKNKKHK